MTGLIPLPENQTPWLNDLKDCIHNAQQLTILPINTVNSIVLVNWPISEFVQTGLAQLSWHHQLTEPEIP